MNIIEVTHMNLRFPPHFYILIVTSLLSLGLAFIVWSRRRSPGVRYFFTYLMAMVLWTSANAVEAMVVEQSLKIFWNQIGYIGFVSVAPLLYLFTAEYIHQQGVSVRRSLILWLIPVTTLILAWTNGWHGLMWSAFTPGSVEPMC
jgi:hypothetical protein